MDCEGVTENFLHLTSSGLNHGWVCHAIDPIGYRDDTKRELLAWNVILLRSSLFMSLMPSPHCYPRSCASFQEERVLLLNINGLNHITDIVGEKETMRL